MMNAAPAEFSAAGLDRICAILLYKGVFYVSEDNHQDCLRQILRQEGTSYQEKYGLYCAGEDDIDAAAEITYEMQETHHNDIVGFDVYSDGGVGYMVMFDKPDAQARLQQIIEFAKNSGYVLAAYLDRVGNECKIIEQNNNLVK